MRLARIVAVVLLGFASSAAAQEFFTPLANAARRAEMRAKLGLPPGDTITTIESIELVNERRAMWDAGRKNQGKLPLTDAQFADDELWLQLARDMQAMPPAPKPKMSESERALTHAFLMDAIQPRSTYVPVFVVPFVPLYTPPPPPRRPVSCTSHVSGRTIYTDCY